MHIRDQRVACEARHIDRPGAEGSVRLLLYRPLGATGRLPAFLHIHGGGFIMGRPDHQDIRNEALAASAQCVIASVAYWLAPETVAPGAVEDCFLVLQWLADGHDALGIVPVRIVVGGESAGGGLAAALALLARDRGGVQPAYQWQIYPMLHDRTACR